MKRYQLYLNPHSVSVVDVVSETVEMSRSKIIQNVVDRVSKEISDEIIGIALVKKASRKKQYAVLDKYAGFIDDGSKEIQNYSQTVDEIYNSI